MLRKPFHDPGYVNSWVMGRMDKLAGLSFLVSMFESWYNRLFIFLQVISALKITVKKPVYTIYL